MSRRTSDELPRLDDGRGPALPLEQSELRARAEAAIATALGEAPEVEAAPTDERRPVRRRALLLAAALSMVAATAMAAALGAYYGARESLRATPPGEAADTGAPRTPTAPAPATTPEAVLAPMTPQDPAISTEVEEPETGSTGADEPQTAQPQTAQPQTAQPQTAQPRAPDRLPEDLLVRANGLRSERRWRAAGAVYRRIVREHRESEEAYVARVALASLQLDHLGNPRAALGGFRSTLRLRRHGALSEEARYGIAQCHRRLRDRDAERDALAEFLTHHPRGMMAASARARLEELGEADLEASP